MKQTRLFLLAFTLYTFVGFSQDSTAHFSIKSNPQHLIVRAIRLDFEYIFKKSRHGIVIAPSIFTGLYKTSSVLNISNGNEYISDKISGWGVEILHKIYILNIDDDFDLKHKIYIAYGVNQQFVKAEIYERGYFEELNTDGLNQIYFGQKVFIQKFDRKGFAIQVGYESVFYNRIALDIYLGAGYRHSNMESNELKALNNRYKDDSWEYGFTGLEPRIGFRAGVYIF